MISWRFVERDQERPSESPLRSIRESELVEDGTELTIKGYLEELAVEHEFITHRQLRYDLCDVGFEEFDPDSTKSVADLDIALGKINGGWRLEREGGVSLTDVVVSSANQTRYFPSGFPAPRAASGLQNFSAWEMAVAKLWEAYDNPDFRDVKAKIEWDARKRGLVDGRARREQRKANERKIYWDRRSRSLREARGESTPEKASWIRLPFDHVKANGRPKISYQSKEAADLAAQENSEKHIDEHGESERFNAYLCRLGGHYHVGNVH
jgi:hypothetical protein